MVISGDQCYPLAISRSTLASRLSADLTPPFQALRETAVVLGFQLDWMARSTLSVNT